MDGEHINMDSIRKKSPETKLSPDKDIVNIYGVQNIKNNAVEDELNFVREMGRH